MSTPDLQDQKYPWNQIIITLITTLCALFLLLSCYNFLTREWILLNRPRRRLLNEAVANPEDPSLPIQSQGLAPAILHALPAIQFKKTDSEANPSNCDCAVCLGEFDNGEWLRLLPNCSPVFHITCVDAWFQAHPNCPLCRSSVVNDLNSCHDFSSSMSFEMSREDAHSQQMH
ncbi:RING-H2 finger protein ATL16-like [Magnolia sinica]|uniref:RING-H2 finger protein ATL16-like n=1 Tax=Magnolia sinica TaxID=86752 RepID=UPI00265B27A8|nr:RING-H2 finger protein ATL16-like [Magnolia sinica]